ncbi:peroxiredoxin-like family protein [Candidatus Albibeggiatoa sp. nov. BB20]|uniref:peroxiredoxin-like family protein n=1 Tax=Candidatus Albibeggiatoa sp. nov. BB20 TaxID=3162723 RepID=UPI00336576C1
MMSLQEQLATLKAQNIAALPKQAVDIILNDIKTLSQSGIIEGAPKVGETLKDFRLSNHLGDTRDLAQLRQKGAVVVTFYRGGWCPYCNLELRAYQEVLQDIKAAGAILVAITPELPDESLSTSEKNELAFEVLTDTNSDYARELGLVFTLPEELRPVYESFGIEIEKHNGKGQFDLPLAATFIVDADGYIVFAVIDADYTLRAEPTDIVKKLKSLT